jgi:hypothetical protein
MASWNMQCTAFLTDFKYETDIDEEDVALPERRLL